MQHLRTRWPWYVAMFAAYPLLYIAVTNPGQVAAMDVVPVVIAGVAAALALVLLLRLFIGNWAAVGLAAAWVVLLFYLYGPVNAWWIDWVRDALEDRAAEPAWYNAHPQLVHSVAWVLFALAGIARIRRAAPRMIARADRHVQPRRRPARGPRRRTGRHEPGARGARGREAGPGREDRRGRRAPLATRTSISSCSTATPGPTC